MATEEQTTLDGHFATVYGGTGAGQRLTISSRAVSKLSFPLQKIGSPGSGNVVYYIRKVSDDSLITSKVWGNATAVPTSVTWLEVTFDTPVFINKEVRLIVVNLGSGSAGHGLGIHASWVSDVKANEYYFGRDAGGAYTEQTTYDDGYIYTYISQEPGGGVYPVDDVARVSSIRHVYRPGFYRMQVGIGALGFDMDIAETLVRRALDTAVETGKPPSQWPPAPGEDPTAPVKCPYCEEIVPWEDLAEHVKTVHGLWGGTNG